MDNQSGMPGGSNPSDNTGGGMPAGDAPATTPMDQPAPQAEEKCSTCGNQAAGGNCVPCGQPTANCSCPPTAPSSEQGGTAAPSGM